MSQLSDKKSRLIISLLRKTDAVQSMRTASASLAFSAASQHKRSSLYGPSGCRLFGCRLAAVSLRQRRLFRRLGRTDRLGNLLVERQSGGGAAGLDDAALELFERVADGPVARVELEDFDPSELGEGEVAHL